MDKVIGWGRKNLPLLKKKPQLSLEEDIAGREEGEVRLLGAIGVRGGILCPFPRLWLFIPAPPSSSSHPLATPTQLRADGELLERRGGCSCSYSQVSRHNDIFNMF